MDLDGERPGIPAGIRDVGVVAIGRRLGGEGVVAIAEGLVAGGVRAFELTLNEPEGPVLASIEVLAHRFSETDLLIGAGTVLSIAAAERAIGAGARFLVSPHLDVELVRWAASRGVPCFPGALTPSEVLAAWRAGAAAVKLFPASVAGPSLVREMRGPLPGIPLLPTGGVTLESAAAFIMAGAVGVGMGGWLTGDGATPGIELRAARIVAAVATARAQRTAAGAGLAAARPGPGTSDVTVEVITLGECLFGLIADSVGSLAEATRFERHVVGAEANVAVGLARLGHSVGYIGRVGDDPFGTAILRRLRGEGVDVAWLRREAAAATGLLIRERQPLGPSEVLYRRTGSAGSLLAPEDVADAAASGLFAGARWLHVTGITPALSADAAAAVSTAIGAARGAGLTVSLDINLRRRLWTDEVAAATLRRLAADVDVIFGGREEAAVVTGARPDREPAGLAAALLDLGPRLAVIKLGAQGALALEPGAPPVVRAAVAVSHVVDSVGAGDAFCAGFIAARMEGRDVGAAVRMGNACGAAAVSALGDLTGLPERAALDRLLAADDTDDTLR